MSKLPHFSITFNKTLIFGFAIAFLLVSLIGITSYLSIQQQQRDAKLAMQNILMVDAIEDYQKLLVDLQTGRRGFIITGDSAFMKPYMDALELIGPLYLKIDSMILDLPVRQKFGDVKLKVDNLISFYQESKKLIKERRIYSEEMYENVVLGKQKMDSILLEINNILYDERKNLIAINSQSEKSSERANQIIVFGSIVISLIIISLIYIIIVEIKRRTLLELNLHDKNIRIQKNTNETARINKQLDEFVYAVSHDLKSPLNGIYGMMTIMSEQLEEKKDFEMAGLAKMAMKSAHELTHMISGVLEYSRISRTEGGKVGINLTTFLQDLVNLMYPPKSITINIPENLPNIFTDKYQLHQVFQNLIGNAIKFIDQQNGIITITCEDIDEFYRFGVQDNGPGINPKSKERIFLLFQTESGKRTKNNTGIGLAIVKRLVEGKGGVVTLETEPGKGSCFYFTWPK